MASTDNSCLKHMWRFSDGPCPGCEGDLSTAEPKRPVSKAELLVLGAFGVGLLCGAALVDPATRTELADAMKKAAAKREAGK